MSGAMVAIGCGYIVLAHATKPDSLYAVFESAAFIVERFRDIMHNFNTSVDCPNAKIALMSTQPFVFYLETKSQHS